MKRNTKKYALTILLKRLRKLAREFRNELTENRFLGLCGITQELWDKDVITDKEYKILQNLLKEQRQVQSSFWTHTNIPTEHNDQFFWKFGAFAPRERWIKHKLASL